METKNESAEIAKHFDSFWDELQDNSVKPSFFKYVVSLVWIPLVGMSLTLLVDILIFDLHLLLSKEKILGLSSKTHGHGISRTFSDSLKNIFLTWEKFQFEKSKKLIKVDSSSYHVEISQVFRKVIFGVSFEFLNLLHKSNSRIRAVI